ncbi:MAG: carboxypeptidase-like regulatory domain-containing protein [Thermoanaerobaculia bacterium]
MTADRRPRMLPARPHRTLALGLALVALLAARGVSASGPYQEGQDIEITGTVTDEAGHAVEGVTVVLEASRRAWRWSAINLEDKGRTIVDTARRQGRTDAGGRFTIAWRWHDYYNRFALLTARPAADGSGKLVEIERIDLTRRIEQGSPVVTSFIIPSSARPAPTPTSGSRSGSAPATGAGPSRPPAGSDAVTQRFEQAAQSVDEKNVYEAHGRPDRVEVFDRPGAQEVTWWYFEDGKAYRFEDGDLVQVVPFDPVEPFEDGGRR